MNESSYTHSTVPDAVTAEVGSDLACNSTGTTSLTAFPRLAAVFRKYNAALPNSAAVKRLFSLQDRFSQPQDARC